MKSQEIIFDLDGTLWDSSEQVAKVWCNVLAHQPDVERPVTAADMKHLMGKTMTDVFEALMPSLSEKRRAEIGEECCRAEQEYLLEYGAALYPGVPETLETLSQSYRLAIVSNCQKGYIESFLNHYQFGHFFADTECFGQTGKCKGENIRILLHRSRPEKAVYVGDTLLDFEAAQLAGIPFLHAAYGFGKVPGAAFVSDFGGLPRAAAEILQK